MGSAAWKDLERRVCRALGAERRPSVGPRGWARGTDDDGSAPFAVEVKRTKRWQLRATWLVQAKANAKQSGKPWLLVIGVHHGARPVAVLDFYALVQLAQEAGRLPVVAIEDPEGGHMSEQDIPTPPSEPPPEEGDDTPPEDDDGDDAGVPEKA